VALAVLLVISFLYTALVLIAYRTVPTGNTTQTHFDAIVVLGYPSQLDGTPSPEQRARVREAVAEYRRGVAAHLILTGGPAHNNFVEAHTMALFAQSLGVPAAALIEEGQAHNTIENIYFSKAILDRNGWSSAEIVSAPSHIPRAALILTQWDKAGWKTPRGASAQPGSLQPPQSAHPLAWHTHAAQSPPESPFYLRAILYTREALECWRLRTFGFTPNPYLPQP
jgi:uncharacterized SAM-binding protein YcdF (DUF218 family)